MNNVKPRHLRYRALSPATVRLIEAEKNKIDNAAKLCGMPRAAFMREASLMAANNVLTPSV